jgi:Rps23 Pro-64 3,4-dihydroxylase Tpa1-like proline 4-hydroxylase
MNHDWKDEYNGHLELWERDYSREVVKIAPVFNRVVIFDIENAPHGHLTPLMVPSNISRYSLALYYFLPKASEEPRPVFFSNDDYIFQMTRLK